MLRYKIHMIIIKVIVAFLRIFPEKVMYSMIEKLGKYLYEGAKYRKDITLGNLRTAFPDAEESKLEEIAKNSYINIVKGFFMTFWVKEFTKPEKAKYVNEDIVDEALAKNKGLIIIALHMGCVDGSVRVSEKIKVNTVYKKQSNPYLDEFIVKQRQSVGFNSVAKGNSAMRTLVKAIRRKECVILVADHYDSTGTEAEFFGRKTKMSSGPINLAMKYDASVIYMFNEIHEDNTVSVHFERGFDIQKTDDSENDFKVNLDRMVKGFEDIIKAFPEQWMWFHKRYK